MLVSVAGLPCNRPQTLKSRSAGGKVRRQSPKACHAAALRSSGGAETQELKAALPGAAKLSGNRVAVVAWPEWVGSSVLGGCYAPWMSAFTMQGSNQRWRTAGQPSWTPDALRLRFGLPTCVSLQPPAKFPPCPCVSCCAALEASFSLLRLPGLFLNTCACLARATPRHRRPTRIYLEYNTQKRNIHCSLTPTLRTRESLGGYL